MKSKLLTFDTKQWIAIAAGTVVAVFLVAAFASAAVTISANVQVGGGTPGLTLNGDDLYVTGTFEVDGVAQLDGVTTFNANLVLPANTDLTFTGTTGTNEIVLTASLVDALSITDAGASTFMTFDTQNNKVTFSHDVVFGELVTFDETMTFNSLLKFSAGTDLSFIGTTGTNDIKLTNALADALSITDGSSDIVVYDTNTAGNVITYNSLLSVDDTTDSTSGITGSFHTDGGLGVLLDLFVGGAVTADAYNVTSGTPITTSGDLSKAQLQAASFFTVDTSSGAVDIDIWEGGDPDAADVGRQIIFANINGGTNTMTITNGTGFTTVTYIDAGGTAAEDTGDLIICTITTTDTATCVGHSAD